MRLSVPLVGLFIAAGGCCCCPGGIFQRIQMELDKAGVKMPDMPGADATSGGGANGTATTGGGDLPGDLAGFPAFDGAEIQGSPMSVAGVTTANYSLPATAKPAAAVDFYADYAKNHGWTEVTRSNAGGTSTFQGKKDGKMFSVTATSQGGTVWLTLSVSPGM
jgi:hypothetical protein